MDAWFGAFIEFVNRPAPASLWYRFMAMKAPISIKKITRAITQLCIGAMALLSASMASAVLIEGLYVGEAKVDQVRGVDRNAQLKALDEVLFRLTGLPNGAQRLSISTADLAQLIQSRQIIERSVVNAAGEPITELRERVEFDALAIDQLLANQELKRWGRERASVLVWAVMEEGFQVELLDDPMLEATMRELGRRLGLDLIRPLGDALDLSELSLADVRGGFLDQTEPGLARYGASVALMLDLRPDMTGWLARAFWRIDGVDGGQSFLGPSPQVVLERALEALFQAMVRRYAIDLNDQASRTQRVRIIDLSDPVQYAEVLGYLRNLGVVERVRVIEARGQQMEFELTLRGDNLVDILAVGQTLEVLNTDPTGLIELRLR